MGTTQEVIGHRLWARVTRKIVTPSDRTFKVGAFLKFRDVNHRNRFLRHFPNSFEFLDGPPDASELPQPAVVTTPEGEARRAAERRARLDKRLGRPSPLDQVPQPEEERKSRRVRHKTRTKASRRRAPRNKMVTEDEREEK